MNGTIGKQTSGYAKNANLHTGTKKKLTQERLLELMTYNPKTGVFVWNRRRISQDRWSRIEGRVVGWNQSSGYLGVTIDRKQYLLHRLAWFYVHGYFPEFEIDHINHNKQDNSLKNLREVSHICNSKNCKRSKNNSSGITGVRWRQDTQSWCAAIMVMGKAISMSGFKNKTEAALKRLEMEKEHGFVNCNIQSDAQVYLKNKGIIAS